MFASLCLIVGGFVFVRIAVIRLDRDEKRYALAAFAFHILASFGQYALQEYYYRGDAFGYLDTGRSLARLLDADFGRFAPELVRLLLHLDTDLPFEPFGAGESTGTMSAIAGFWVYFWGPSLLPACVATSILGWFGQFWLYVAGRESFVSGERLPVAIGCMLVPSVVFWGSAFEKEAFVLAPFGLLTLSAFRLLRGRFAYVPVALVAIVGVAILKPYILWPFVVATAAWIYAARTGDGPRRRLRPVYLTLAVLVAVAGITVIGYAFPELGLEHLGKSVAEQQARWQTVEGGSDVQVGSEQAKSLMGQLPYVPLALFNALFRPLIFEIRNGPMLGAALETTVLMVLIAAVIWRAPFSRAKATLLASPPLLFSVVFTLLFAIAVGLATRNLGSLSRYRVPMMPFYVTAILVLRQRLRPAPDRRAAPLRMATASGRSGPRRQ